MIILLFKSLSDNSKNTILTKLNTKNEYREIRNY